MTKPWLTSLVCTSCLLLAGFWVGEVVHRPYLVLPSTHLPGTAPQDRGPGPGKPPGTPDPTTPAEPLYYGSDAGQGAAGNGVIAVTGSYGVGTSVLYVIDTNTKQLAVYEARGGGSGSRRIHLVGARRIDLDLMLEGYNDDSELSYDALRQRFKKAGHELNSAPGVEVKPKVDSVLERSGLLRSGDR
jgi:hypothetical protein